MRDIIRLSTGQIELEHGHLLPAGGGEPVGLTAMEVALLTYLSERPGQTVGRDELLQEVWGYHEAVQSRAVDQTVKRLRRKIEVDPSEPTHLLSEPGVGYQLHVLAPERPRRPKLPLYGRTRELEALQGWWERGRAHPLVLWGPPGQGKSHLARAFLSRVTDEVVWVELRGARTGMEEALLGALGGVGTLQERLGRLGTSTLVLDGVEGLLEEVSALLQGWRRPADGGGVVLTSLHRLPLEQGTVLEVEGLDPVAAKALFLARAEAVAAGVAARDADGVERVVRVTEGSPLALGWVAARLALFTPSAMAQRLEAHDTRLWKGGLDRALSWSWSLLEPGNRAVLTRLATTFRGGFEPSTALEVLGGDFEVLEALQRLRDASWLAREAQTGRLHVPLVVRSFVEGEGEEADRDRHGAWVTGWARDQLAASPWVAWRPEGWVLEERENLRHAADRWEAAGRHGEASEAQELAGRVASACAGADDEAWHRAQRAVALAERSEDPHRIASALRLRGHLHTARGDDHASDADHRRAVELALRAGDPDEAARTWLAWGIASNRSGRMEQARELLERAEGATTLAEVRVQLLLELARACCQLGDGPAADGALARARPVLDAVPLAGLRWPYTCGYVALEFGRPAEALQHFRAALRWASDHGRSDLVDLLVGLPVVPFLLLDDVATARAQARRSHAAARTPLHRGEDGMQSGLVALFDGAPEEAEEHARSAWTALRRPRGGFALVLRGILARAAARRGDGEAARAELAEALRWAPPHVPDARAVGLVFQALVASALGDGVGAQRWANEAVVAPTGGPRRLPELVRLGLHLLERDGNLSATADMARRR